MSAPPDPDVPDCGNTATFTATITHANAAPFPDDIGTISKVRSAPHDVVKFTGTMDSKHFLPPFRGERGEFQVKIVVAIPGWTELTWICDSGRAAEVLFGQGVGHGSAKG